MAIPFVNDRLLKPSRSRISIDRWYGLNYTDTVANGECTEMKNISSDGTYLLPRPPREVIASGIENPQRILFCGDKLSYIAGGKLNVQSGEGFDEVGEVGNVTSAVDFNNTDMLFYPTNFVYNYEAGDISTITDYLTLSLGSYGGKASSTVHGFGDNCDNVNVFWRGNSYNHRICATIAIGSSDSSKYINATAKEKKDDAGNTVYNEITINVTGNNPRYITDGIKNDSRHMKLFVRAWDDKGNLISSSDFYETNYTANYTECDFGKPILFNGVAPAKILAMIGYYYTPTTTSWNGFCDQGCIDRRTEDLNNENFKVWVTSTEYPAVNSLPAISYACMDNNRVVGVEGNNFYASCLGDYANWIDFDDAEGNPKATGSYAEELYTYGDFTGITKYRNNVIITKKNMLYECYGNKPPYRINLAANVGCVDCRSMVEVSGVLYWLGAEGVYRYSGGLPVNISHKINPEFGKFTKGCAATDGRRYYIYAEAEKKAYLLVYDTQTGLWCCEDDIEIADMTSFDNAVYALTMSGTLYKFNSGSEDIEWEYETKDFDLNSGSKKIPKKITLKVDATLNAGLDIYIRYDNGGYKRIASYSTFQKSVVDIQLKNKVCDSFSLKFCGRGYVRIYGINVEVIGSGKKHNDDNLVRY